MRQIQEQLQHGFEAHRYTNCERTLTDMETQTDATKLCDQSIRATGHETELPCNGKLPGEAELKWLDKTYTNTNLKLR